MITVVVGAASSFARGGLEAVLARDPTVRVVASVPPESAAGVTLDSGAPDVLLLEVAAESDVASITEGDGQSAPTSNRPAVVVLAEAVSARAAAAALRAGARAVLRWEASPEEILGAVHAAAAGLVALPSDVAAELLGPARAGDDGQRDRAAAPPTDTTPLTPREREVLAMLAEGLGNKTIGRRLGISEHTVKTHVAGLFAKLGASSRTEAVAVGVRRGLVVL